jgi:hypothetical protein
MEDREVRLCGCGACGSTARAARDVLVLGWNQSAGTEWNDRASLL